MRGCKRTQAMLVISTIGALATILTGCSASSTSTGASSASNGPVTITFLACCAADQTKTLVAEFEKKYPNITVKTQVVPFENLNSTVEARLGQKDSSFDFYEADQPRTAALASKGFLADITTTFRPLADPTLFPASIQASSWHNKIWSAPLWTSTSILYYNKTLLAKAGVAPPSRDPSARWTWEQVSVAAKKAMSVGAQCGFMFDQPNRFYQLQPLIESAGGGSGLTGSKLLTPDITNAGWTKAMTYYAELYSSGITPRGVPAEQTRALFQNGKCAFFLGVPAIPTFDTTGLSYGYAPSPYFDGGKPATPTDSFALGVNPYTKNMSAALKFIEYASTDTAGNLAAVADNPNPTPNKAALPTFFAQVEAKSPAMKGVGTLVQYELQNTAVHRPASTGYIIFETTINNAFSDISNGKGVQPTLAQAQKDLIDQLSR